MPPTNKRRNRVATSTQFLSVEENWNAGLTVGYEFRVVKHLNLMFRLSGSVKDVLKSDNIWGKKLFPVQAGLTLSFDVLRIGDCGCD